MIKILKDMEHDNRKVLLIFREAGLIVLPTERHAQL